MNNFYFEILSNFLGSLHYIDGEGLFLVARLAGDDNTEHAIHKYK